MMKPNEYPKEIYNALYSDEFGDVVGLDEVMYIDPLLNRIDLLKSLLENPDNYIAYQAALIITAWGNVNGINFLSQLITIESDKKSKALSDSSSLSEEIFDEIGRTARLYELAGGDKQKTLECYKLLLKIYPLFYFRGSFCDSLLNSELTVNLHDDLTQAHNLTYSNNNYFQASVILPSIMKNFPASGENIIRTNYLPNMNIDSLEMEFVAEALAFSKSQEFTYVLKTLSSSKNQLTREKARKSLEFRKL